jgi:hypothetical protein
LSVERSEKICGLTHAAYMVLVLGKLSLYQRSLPGSHN